MSFNINDTINDMITSFDIEDIRFPTSLTGDGTDAMNKACDYSAAYITIKTSNPTVVGYGMTFTIGRGNEIVCQAIQRLAKSLLHRNVHYLLSDMGRTWSFMTSDSQLRWIGPEKGVIHLATAAIMNALWDMLARAAQKPLWKLVTDFSPEEFVKCVSFRYITDAITPDEALNILKSKQKGKAEREAKMLREGYPAYTTSAGWFGYSDDKMERLLKESIAQGLTHFKIKIGDSLEGDRKRLALVRKVIDDPVNCAKRATPSPASIQGKNAGPTGSVLMVDANQVWDVPQAIERMKNLAEFKPWFIEEPTAPDDILGHAAIRKALKPFNIGVATGEHAHNRMVFKQLLQAEAIDVCQIDSCRLASVNEILAVLLMAAKSNCIVCPHAGGVGLCEYVIHLSLIDYIAVSGSIDSNVLEYVDHLHEHFTWPCSLNDTGRYNVPLNKDEGYSIRFKPESIGEFRYPDGSYWKKVANDAI